MWFFKKKEVKRQEEPIAQKKSEPVMPAETEIKPAAEPAAAKTPVQPAQPEHEEPAQQSQPEPGETEQMEQEQPEPEQSEPEQPEPEQPEPEQPKNVRPGSEQAASAEDRLTEEKGISMAAKTVKKEKKAKKEKKNSLYDWNTSGKKKNDSEKKEKVLVEKKTVTVRSLVLGSGSPKICVPVTGTTETEIMEQAEKAAAAVPDLVEWRADDYEDILDTAKAEEMLNKIADRLKGIPLLFTYRSKKEGGKGNASSEQYQMLVNWAAGQHAADMIDVEGNNSRINAEILVRQIRKTGKPVIASAHFFKKMPKKEEMEKTLDILSRTGADVLKLAVMPEKAKDVLKLMAVTEEKDHELAQPLVTMAMGEMGRVSRVSGRLTGSALTFGTAGAGSAPGQIPAEDLRKIISCL